MLTVVHPFVSGISDGADATQVQPSNWNADHTATGLTVRVATAAALATNTRSSNILTASSNGAISVDGVSPVLNDRVLVKNEATTANNGVYYVSQVGDGSNPWKLTRAVDMDAWADAPGSFVSVQEGTANADTIWLCTSNTGGTLNTTAITWVEVGGAIGTVVQAYDATLTSIAALGTAADKLAYTTGTDTWAETAFTSAGRALVDDADASAQRTTLGLAIGTNVQAYDATLTSIAALGTAADKLAYTTGTDTWAETAFTAAGRALVDDADAAAQLTTLGAAPLAGNKNLTGGFTATSYSAGTKSSGTFTPDSLNGNFQHYTNGGAHTLAPPASPCTIVLECTNASAGAITTSGFSVVNGDTYSSTGTKKHVFTIVKTNSYSILNVTYVTGT